RRWRGGRGGGGRRRRRRRGGRGRRRGAAGAVQVVGMQRPARRRRQREGKHPSQATVHRSNGTYDGRVKYVVCVPDGAADEPLEELGGRTPLEAASLPNLRALAGRAEVGRAATIPDGMPPGSDVGNMAILGYDPARHHTGRAPIEAAALGIALADDEVAYRCNLVAVGPDGTMVDFAGGHPSSEDAARVIAALDEALGTGEVSFH